MLCPQCCTTWEEAEDYMAHLEAHGLDPWRCKSLVQSFKLLKAETGQHKPSEPCKCPMWGSRFECEMKIYRAR